jgi:hypothetical protein
VASILALGNRMYISHYTITHWRGGRQIVSVGTCEQVVPSPIDVVQDRRWIQEKFRYPVCTAHSSRVDPEVREEMGTS